MRASIFHNAPLHVADHMIGWLKLVKQSHKSRRVGCGAFGAHGGDVNDVWRRGRNPGRGFGCPFLRRAVL